MHMLSEVASYVHIYTYVIFELCGRQAVAMLALIKICTCRNYRTNRCVYKFCITPCTPEIHIQTHIGIYVATELVIYI